MRLEWLHARLARQLLAPTAEIVIAILSAWYVRLDGLEPLVIPVLQVILGQLVTPAHLVTTITLVSVALAR